MAVWRMVAPIVAVAVVPPMLVGGAPGWAVPAIGVLCGSAMFMLPRPNALLPLTRADYAVFGLFAWTGMQLVPLPRFLHDWLGTSRQQVVGRTLELTGASSAWLPLSLDPGATMERLVVGASIVAAFWIGRHAGAMGNRSTVRLAVLGSCALIACTGFAHELVSAERVFGLWAPQNTAPQLLTPLLNNNHLGGFLAMGVPLGIALGQDRGRREVRGLALTGAVLCGVGALLATSRGAVIGLMVGVAATLAHALRRAGPDRRRAQRVALLTAATTLAFAMHLGLEPLYRDFESDLSKIDLAREGLQLTIGFPVAGVGRGAFSTAFLPFDSSDVWTTHPENILVQWASEWGIPAALAGCVLLLPIVLRACLSSHGPTVGAGAAILGAIAHDLVDFMLEMPGTVTVLALLLGAHVARERASRRGPGSVWSGRSVRIAVALTVVFVGPLAPGLRRESLVDAVREAADVSTVEALSRRIARAHPLDAGLVLWVGHQYAVLGDSRSFAWLNRSMELAPAWASPHVIAAQELMRRGAYRQGLLEVREAEERSHGSAISVACELLRRDPLQATSSLDLLQPMLEQLQPCISTELKKTLDDGVLSRGTATGPVLLRSARRALLSGRHADARTLLVRAEVELAEDDIGAIRLRAELLSRTDSDLAALHFLHTKTDIRAPAFLRHRASLASRTGEIGLLAGDLELLRSTAMGSPAALVREHVFAGELHERTGRYEAALMAYESARRLAEDDEAILQSVARVAEQLGQRDRARAIRAELCRRGRSEACGGPPRVAP